MGGANDVALELVAQNFGVAALHAAGHGLADPWEGLMAIQAAELDYLAIQFEALIGELGFAETETARVFVKCLTIS